MCQMSVVPYQRRGAVGGVAAVAATAIQRAWRYRREIKRIYDEISKELKRRSESSMPNGRPVKRLRSGKAPARPVPLRYTPTASKGYGGGYKPPKRYVKKFGAKKRMMKMKSKKRGPSSVKSYYTRGLVRKVETSFTLSGTDSVYVGHAFAPNQLFYVVVENLVRELFKKAGNPVVSMNENVYGTGPNIGNIGFTYRKYAGDVDNLVTFNVVPGNTYELVANTMYTSIGSVMTSSDFILVAMLWTPYNNATTDNSRIVMDCTRMTLEFDCISGFKCQNRTLAVSATAADNELVTDVAANPLNGFCYTGYGNAPVIRKTELTAGIVDYTMASAAGAISFDAYLNLPVLIRNDFRRPPYKKAFQRAMSQKPVKINPGYIRKSYITWHKTVDLNRFLSDVREFIGIDPCLVSFGKFELLGLERLCNASAANVSVGCEISATYRVQFHRRSATTNAIIAVI